MADSLRGGSENGPKYPGTNGGQPFCVAMNDPPFLASGGLSSSLVGVSTGVGNCVLPKSDIVGDLCADADVYEVETRTE